jgi:hypothetical protein
MDVLDLAISVADGDSSLGGLVHAGDAVENGGFAGAVRPDERGDFAFVDVHGDAIDCAQASECHRKIFDFEYRLF